MYYCSYYYILFFQNIIYQFRKSYTPSKPEFPLSDNLIYEFAEAGKHKLQISNGALLGPSQSSSFVFSFCVCRSSRQLSRSIARAKRGPILSKLCPKSSNSPYFTQLQRTPQPLCETTNSTINGFLHFLLQLRSNGVCCYDEGRVTCLEPRAQRTHC